MKIVVVGSACMARRVLLNGDCEQSWLGSAQASGAGLATILGPEHEIHLVARVGENVLDDYRAYVEREWRDRLRTDHVLTDPRGANQAVVSKTGGGGRFFLKYLYAPDLVRVNELPWKLLAECDAVILNAGCPRNFDPEIVRMLREELPNLYVYVDVHCLIWELNDDLSIRYAPWPDWKRLLPLADEVQMNLTEAREMLAMPESSPLELLWELHDGGVRHAVITDGQHGSWTLAHGELLHVPSISSQEVIDPVGTGDAYGGAFVAARMMGYQMQTAMRLGSVVGASTCGRSGYLHPGDLSVGAIERAMQTTYASGYYGTFFHLAM